MTRQPSGNKEYEKEFENTAIALRIPQDRWDEPVVREGIPLLIRAEQLQIDLDQVPLDIFRDGVTFGRPEVLMRCVCAMLKDKITGKSEYEEYIKGKLAACGYHVIGH